MSLDCFEVARLQWITECDYGGVQVGACAVLLESPTHTHTHRHRYLFSRVRLSDKVIKCRGYVLVSLAVVYFICITSMAPNFNYLRVVLT